MSRQRARARTEGMTLIEIMVVIVIIAVAMTGVSFGLGRMTRSELRSACAKVAAAARFAYHRAITKRGTVRIVFTVGGSDEGQLSFEEAHGQVLLARTGDATREELDESEADQAAVDPWAAAEARLSKTLTPSFGASPFGAITDDEGNALARYGAQPIGSGDARVVKLITPHEREPRTEGRGSIYFFPAGQTEHAILHLTVDDDAETVYSVEIHPLTGRARVYDHAYEPEVVGDDAAPDEGSEVRDPS